MQFYQNSVNWVYAVSQLTRTLPCLYFFPFLQRETTLVTSCLFPQTTKPFQNVVVLEGLHHVGKQTGRTKSCNPLVKMAENMEVYQ